MKHTIEVKLPKLFGKKKQVEDTPVVRTEIEPEDVAEVIQPKLQIQTKHLKNAGIAAAGVTVGYLVGNKRGMKTALKHVGNTAKDIIVIK